MGRCLDLLLPDPLIETDAPASAEVTVMQQDGRQIVHLVNYHAQRRSPAHVEALEAPVPLHNVNLRLRRPGKTGSVRLASTGAELPFTVRDGAVAVTVPRVGTSEIVVFSDAD